MVGAARRLAVQLQQLQPNGGTIHPRTRTSGEVFLSPGCSSCKMMDQKEDRKGEFDHQLRWWFNDI